MTEIMKDPSLVTKRAVPCAFPGEMEIYAGWNGNVGSYYGVCRWIKTQSPTTPAGSIDLEVGYPDQLLPEISDLAKWLSDHIDYHSPHLVLAFRMLLTDKLLQGAANIYAENPYGQKLLPDLIGMVLDGDYSPVDKSK